LSPLTPSSVSRPQNATPGPHEWVHWPVRGRASQNGSDEGESLRRSVRSEKLTIQREEENLDLVKDRDGIGSESAYGPSAPGTRPAPAPAGQRCATHRPGWKPREPGPYQGSQVIAESVHPDVMSTGVLELVRLPEHVDRVDPYSLGLPARHHDHGVSPELLTTIAPERSSLLPHPAVKIGESAATMSRARREGAIRGCFMGADSEINRRRMQRPPASSASDTCQLPHRTHVPLIWQER
jgi:hypothetical protein